MLFKAERKLRGILADSALHKASNKGVNLTLVNPTHLGEIKSDFPVSHPIIQPNASILLHLHSKLPTSKQ